MFIHLLLPFLFSSAHAQNKPLTGNRQMSITYGSPSWNTDSSKIDSAFLILRDKASGKIVQIQLEETEPDSSKFVGNFSINIGPSDKITPEIFIPPADLRGTSKDNRKLFELIQNNKLPRKPVIWKKNERGQANLDVYDTREQAETALRAYQNEVALKNGGLNLTADTKSRGALEAVASDQAKMVAAQVARQQELDKLAAEAAKHESDRVRLEQIERQKADERLRQAAAASEKEQAERRAKAAALGKSALEDFNAGDFAAAEAKFKQSVELDPANKEYYFKYGVTLYRNGKYNDALVTFNVAKPDPATDLEKSYYVGLTHYRLKELPAAMGEFSSVVRSNDPIMAPSSEFYRGVIFFVQEKYEDSKTSFEKVIDTSKDPRLDEQAEQYIDRIADASAFAQLRAKRFTFIGTVGGMYDSNVLLAPDSSPDQGSQTNIADFRLLTIGDLDYRPVFTEKNEFSLHASASLTNSLKNESAPADPYVYSIAAPYSYKGAIGKKGIKATVKPGYEALYMAADGGSTKVSTLASAFVLFDVTMVMSPTWFSNYNFEYRKDDLQSAGSIGPDNGDANKYSLRTNQTMFLDKARKQALIGSLGYVKNSADGDNKIYNRFEVGATFVRPAFWNTSWNLGLAVYKLTYPDASIDRSDFDVTLSTGLNKPVKDWLIWGVQANYTKNDSNIDAYEYSKYTVMTTATFITNW